MLFLVLAMTGFFMALATITRAWYFTHRAEKDIFYLDYPPTTSSITPWIYSDDRRREYSE